jgi:uncharacterized protein YndB with AHSA1/START domain
MAHPFEVRKEIEVQATPDEVWQAIATGPGIDSWFMGTNEVEPREGGQVRMTLPGWTLQATVKAWEPPTRLRTETDESDDGRFMAFEYLVEGRGGGSTVLRFVHNGFLSGEDWEAEYEALKNGDPMYIDKLGEYLTYFRGRTGVPVTAYGPQVDGERAWTVFSRGLGLDRDVAVGDDVRVNPDGLAPFDAVVDHVSPATLGLRSGDGLYRFIHGLGGTVVLGHHIFAPVNQQETERAWQGWVDRVFA